MRRQDDRRDIGVYTAQLVHQCQPVAIGKHEVDDAEVEKFFFHRPEGFRLIAGCGYFVIRRLEPHTNQLQQIRIIIDN